MQKYLIGLLLAAVGVVTVNFWPSKTNAPQSAKQGTETSCGLSATRPCYDRVTPGKVVRIAAKAGENSLKACLSSKSPSLRGFGHTKTTLSDLESYQYCFEGKSTVQVRFFAGSAGSPIVPSSKPKPPKLACTPAPEFSILGWLDPSAPWSIQEPSRIIETTWGAYIYSYAIDTILQTKSGTLLAAGYAGEITAAGWIPVVKRSTDNGVNWKSIPLPDAPPNWGFVYSLAEDHNGVLYAGGTAFWKSIDNGNTWTIVPTPYRDTYWGGSMPISHMTIAKDNALIAAFGASYSVPSKVYRSADTGSTWNELFGHEYVISSIIEADDSSLVFRSNVSTAGESNVYRYFGGTLTKTFTDYINISEPTAGLLKARDGALYLVSVDKSADIDTIDYTEPGHGFLAAYKSGDNGITWTQLRTLPNS